MNLVLPNRVVAGGNDGSIGYGEADRCRFPWYQKDLNLTAALLKRKENQLYFVLVTLCPQSLSQKHAKCKQETTLVVDYADSAWLP